MLNFSQLRCFIKVAEHLNYNRAAEDLRITATAVSKQIKNLEDQLGEKLFIRDTRKVQLTLFGLMLLEKCQKLLQETQLLEQFIESRQTIPHGQITILVSTILARELILDRLADFINQYPLIECEFLFSEQDNDLARKDIDVMVSFPEIPPFTDQLKYRKMNPAAKQYEIFTFYQPHGSQLPKIRAFLDFYAPNQQTLSKNPF